MNFNLQKSIELLERTPQAYKAIFYNMSNDWDIINEGPNTWSAFDIVGHLIHGEKTDWIPRAKLILSDAPNKKFDPFDRFAQEKLTVGKTMNELLDEFTTLRTQNLNTLKSWNLTGKDLAKEGIHPALGTVTLKQHLASWTIHDMSHMNQLSRVIIKHYGEAMGPWKQYSRILSKD